MGVVEEANMALPAHTQSEEKRALAGARRRRRLMQLAADYGGLIKLHPDLASIIRGHLADLLQLAGRTRETERAAVWRALSVWGETGLTVAELAEEADVSAWAARTILDEFLSESPPLVAYSERVSERGRRARVYFPAGESPNSK